MPINSWATGHVNTVGLGTIEPTTQTVGGSVSDAVDQDVGLNQGLLGNGMMGHISAEQMTTNIYTYQTTPAGISLHTYNSTWNPTVSTSQQPSDTDSNIHPTGTNLYMNTKTNTEKPAASKPVTLTMTGQLKPNITIKEKVQKSSRSTKKPVTNSLLAAINGW